MTSSQGLSRNRFFFVLQKLIQQEVSLCDKITHVEAAIKVKEEEATRIARKMLEEKDIQVSIREIL